MGDEFNGADNGASAVSEAQLGSSMAAGAFAAIVSRICTRETVNLATCPAQSKFQSHANICFRQDA